MVEMGAAESSTDEEADSAFDACLPEAAPGQCTVADLAAAMASDSDSEPEMSPACKLRSDAVP